MLPTGPQISALYTLTGPDGTRAVFNDPADVDYVGVLQEITGLDSPDVRENAADNVAMDGGVHGDFYYGRRPITLTGKVLNPASVTARNLRLTQLMRASNAMRSDALLEWTLADGQEQFVNVRRQQPLRVTGTWQKDFQLGLVASDPRIYSSVLHNAEVTAVAGTAEVGRGYDLEYDMDFGPPAPNGQLLIDNQGSAFSYPVLTITGPGLNPSVYNLSTGGSINVLYDLADTETLIIDTLNRTVLLNGTASRYGAVDFEATTWWGLEPGINDVRVAFSTFSAGAKLRVDWRDAWL